MTSQNWPHRKALVTGDDSTLFGLLREILRPVDWSVHSKLRTPLSAVQEIGQEPFGCLIIVDTPTSPASEALRCLFKNPIARMTPTILLMKNQGNSEGLLYEKIFNVETAFKPLTPSQFIPSFQKMLKRWELPAMSALRRLAAMNDSEERRPERLAILEKLATDDIASICALQAMISVMVDNGQYKDAEKKILDAFRSQPQNPAVLAQCAWFYLDARMPHYALRFLLKLKGVSPQATMFDVDIAAAHIACGHLNEAIPVLVALNTRNPGNPSIESNLAKLLVAEGRQDDADQIGIPRILLKRVSDAWTLERFPYAINKQNKPNGNKAS